MTVYFWVGFIITHTRTTHSHARSFPPSPAVPLFLSSSYKFYYKRLFFWEEEKQDVGRASEYVTPIIIAISRWNLVQNRRKIKHTHIHTHTHTATQTFTDKNSLRMKIDFRLVFFFLLTSCSCACSTIDVDNRTKNAI